MISLKLSFDPTSNSQLKVLITDYLQFKQLC